MNLIKLCSLCLRTADWLVKHAILAAVVTLLALIAYIQWDNYTVVENADSTAFREYKPTAENEVSFDELRAVNPDVIGWITLDGTAVNYPIVQASDNSKYVNTDVFGEFSLTGAIFLDMRNSADFSDTLSIIYGHDMEGNKMFGGFDLYEDRRITAAIIILEGTYDIGKKMTECRFDYKCAFRQITGTLAPSAGPSGHNGTGKVSGRSEGGSAGGNGSARASSVKTGDESDAAFYLVMLLAATAVMTVCMRRRLHAV